MSLRRFVIGLVVLVVLIAGIAWIDGGERPLHEIGSKIAVPAGAML